MGINLTIPHLHEFVHLWAERWSVNLRDDAEDSISWNLTANSEQKLHSNFGLQASIGPDPFLFTSPLAPLEVHHGEPFF
jgi:hypothetical protein